MSMQIKLRIMAFSYMFAFANCRIRHPLLSFTPPAFCQWPNSRSFHQNAQHLKLQPELLFSQCRCAVLGFRISCGLWRGIENRRLSRVATFLPASAAGMRGGCTVVQATSRRSAGQDIEDLGLDVDFAEDEAAAIASKWATFLPS
jgi:hypothetical protein